MKCFLSKLVWLRKPFLLNVFAIHKGFYTSGNVFIHTWYAVSLLEQPKHSDQFFIPILCFVYWGVSLVIFVGYWISYYPKFLCFFNKANSFLKNEHGNCLCGGVNISSCWGQWFSNAFSLRTESFHFQSRRLPPSLPLQPVTPSPPISLPAFHFEPVMVYFCCSKLFILSIHF